MNSQDSKDKYKWPINTWRNGWHLLLPGKCKLKLLWWSINKNAGKIEGEREVLQDISGYENYHSHYGNQCSDTPFLSKKTLKIKLPYDAATVALGIHPRNTSQHAAQIICSFMYGIVHWFRMNLVPNGT